MPIEIIIKKVQKVLNVNQNSVLIGDARTEMAKGLLEALTEVINRKSNHDRIYYILVHAGIDHGVPGGNVIKERLILLDKPPGKLLGSMLFRIDNKLGDATLEWCLPYDIPAPSILGAEQHKFKNIKGANGILDSAKGLPIFNRSLN